LLGPISIYPELVCTLILLYVPSNNLVYPSFIWSVGTVKVPVTVSPCLKTYVLSDSTLVLYLSSWLCTAVANSLGDNPPSNVAFISALRIKDLVDEYIFLLLYMLSNSSSDTYPPIPFTTDINPFSWLTYKVPE